MARMLGRVSQPWCPTCKTAPGPDCPDIGGHSPRRVRHMEDQSWRAAVLDELVADAAEHGLYDSTAYPRDCR